MPNQLNPEKKKIIYAEWKDVREELDEIRGEMSKKKGREVTEAELMRTLTIKLVNKHRREKGKSELDLDPSSAVSHDGVHAGGVRRN